MRYTVAMAGVLQDPTGDPIRAGVLLFAALAQSGRVVILTDSDADTTEAWLLVHGVKHVDEIIDKNVRLDPSEDLRTRQVRYARSRGQIDFAVEADPIRAAATLEMGVPVLLFAPSVYSHFAFRPDAPKTARPWDEVVAERTRQQTLLDEDRRVLPSDWGAWE